MTCCFSFIFFFFPRLPSPSVSSSLLLINFFRDSPPSAPLLPFYLPLLSRPPGNLFFDSIYKQIYPQHPPRSFQKILQKEKLRRGRNTIKAMVFPSFPVHMDPTNWQQVNQNQENIATENSFQLSPAPPCLRRPPPPPPSQQQHQFNGIGGHEDTGSGRRGSNMLGSIRPGSMVDRVRLARLPLPEAGLKCPRCESTNTKFCYFNNYSLSQPRHFCKTCRRYWTRGGALRNVPAGGGCRRNNVKKSGKSSSRSKSPIRTIERRLSARGGDIGLTSSTTNHDRLLNPGTSNTATTSHLPFVPPPQVTFLPSLQHLGGHHHDFAPRGRIGSLNLQGFPPPFSLTDTGGSGGMDFDGIIISQAQEFSFLSAGLESPTTNGLYPSFDDEGSDQGNMILTGSSELIGDLNYQTKGLDSGGIMSQVTSSSLSPVPIKMEENENSDNQGLLINPSTNNILQLDQLGGGINQVIDGADHDGDQRYNWNGSCTWADISRFITQSPSASHLL